jgi:hypothetical protein
MGNDTSFNQIQMNYFLSIPNRCACLARQTGSRDYSVLRGLMGFFVVAEGGDELVSMEDYDSVFENDNSWTGQIS